MTRFGQIVFGILLILLFLQIIVGFPMPLEQRPETAQLATDFETRKDREHVMGDFHLAESREGNRDWELFAKRAIGSEGDAEWQLEEVKAQFFSEKQLEYTVTGQKGEIESKTRNMKISGDVIMRSANGYVFRTAVLLYNSKERVLRSPVPVQVQSTPAAKAAGPFSVKGNSMEANVDTAVIFIREKVVASKTVANGKSFSVRSNSLKLSGQNASAHFKEQVRIEVDTLRIDGPDAHFEYRTDTDFLKSVIINGGAKVSDIDKYATSESVQFDPEANQLVLSGKPRVVQGQDEIVGERITFVNGGKKVRVEKMKARVEEVPK